MQVYRREAETQPPVERVYIASAILANFKGRKNVEVQLFRSNYQDSELEDLRGKNLVSGEGSDIPQEILTGATEDAALRCLLEAFTKSECNQLETYLKERYPDQIVQLDIAPLPLPLPLGLGPLAELPQGEQSGFINFDQAPGYALPFRVKGWYDLEQHAHDEKEA